MTHANQRTPTPMPSQKLASALNDFLHQSRDNDRPSQATQPAEVTDEQIKATYLAWCKTNGTPESFARAILALRPAAVPMTDGVREQALDMLATLFDAYENGTACYESPDDCAGYLGNAVQIDHDTFHVIASLLNTHRPTINPGITAQAKKETP